MNPIIGVILQAIFSLATLAMGLTITTVGAMDIYYLIKEPEEHQPTQLTLATAGTLGGVILTIVGAVIAKKLLGGQP